MLRTGFEDGCYEHKPRVKSGKDNQWILLKRMLIKGPVPTPYTIIFSSADISQAKKGELLIDVNVNFTCLRCTHTPRLSTWLHLRFFLSYENPTICSFHRILITETKWKPNSSPFLCWPISCCVNSAKPLADTSRNTTSKRPPLYSPNLGFRKFIPRALSSPLPSRN